MADVAARPIAAHHLALAFWVRRALWPALLVAGLAAESVLWRNGQSPPYVVYDLAVGLAAVFVSLLVWEAAPTNRIGPLLVAYSGWLLISPVRFLPGTAWITASWVAQSLIPAVFAHVVLAYPRGRFQDRLDAGFVALAYVYMSVMALAVLSVAPANQLFGGCVGGPCPSPPPFIARNDALFTQLQAVSRIVDAVLVAAFLVLVGRHLFSASDRQRRRFLPIAAIAVVVSVNFAVESWLATNITGAWDLPDLLDHATQLGVGLTFFAVLYASRLERSHVADLLVQLAAAPIGRIEPLLSGMLHDPRLRLARWDPDRAEYLDAAGGPFDQPPDVDGSVTTRIDSSDSPLGLLVHDQMVLDDPRLLNSVVAATRLALDNARLDSQLKARLADVSASRSRLVRAEDEARRRLERDLHDGAQQRLLSIGLALQLARGETPDGSGAAALIDESQSELQAAINELRDLAQGIHPTVLTDQGLIAAVTALIHRLPISVHVACTVADRLPAGVESAAYFLICEALQNTIKHARASRATIAITRTEGLVHVTVSDDGCGVATITGGSGLRGLADRVEAVDGSLRFESAPGEGTTVEAVMPCA